MIILISFACFTLYFAYLHKWVRSCLLREYHFASAAPPQPLPHSPTLSILLALLWLVIVIAGIFWGFTHNPYADYLSINNRGLEILLLVVICLGVGLSHLVVYHLGELRGVSSMKNTALFLDYENQRNL